MRGLLVVVRLLGCRSKTTKESWLVRAHPEYPHLHDLILGPPQWFVGRFYEPGDILQVLLVLVVELVSILVVI
jgi:hypothetical protein